MTQAAEQLYLEVPVWAEFLPSLRQGSRALGLHREYSDAGILAVSGPRLRFNSWEARAVLSSLYKNQVPFDLTGADSKQVWCWRFPMKQVTRLGNASEAFQKRTQLGIEGIHSAKTIPENVVIEQFPSLNGVFRLDPGYGLPECGVRLMRFTNAAVATVPWTVCPVTQPRYDWGVDSISAKHLALNILNAHIPPGTDNKPPVAVSAGFASKFAYDNHEHFSRYFLAAVPKQGGIIPRPAIADWVQERISLELAAEQARENRRKNTRGQGLI